MESYTALLKQATRKTKSVLKSKPTDHQRPTTEHQNALRLNILTGAVLGGLTMLFSRISSDKRMVGLSDQGQEAGISRDQSRIEPISHSKSGF